MLHAAVAALSLVAAAGAASATSGRRADPDAMREALRARGERFSSARAISHYLQARSFLQAGEPEKAAEHLRLAVVYDDESPELRVSLAEALAVLGRLEAAEAEARRAVELAGDGPAAAEAHLLLGRIGAARRRPEEAVRALREAIRVETALAGEGEGPDPRPWRLLAAVLLDAGDEPSAARVLEELALLLPEDSEGFRELGRALLERDEPARAERHLRRAVAIDRRDVEAHRMLAEVHEALRREPEAKDDLLAILRVAPDDGPALLGLGRLAVRRGEPGQAAEWFHRYLRASRPAADAHVAVAFEWLDGGRGEEALAAVRAGVKDVGPEPRLRFAEGIALQELRRFGESVEPLSQVRPEAAEVFGPARLALADALSRLGRHAEAERALQGPIEAEPGDVRLATMRATVLARAGRHAEAVAFLRRAVAERERAAKDEGLPELHAALGESLLRAGRPAEAISTLQGALERRPGDEGLLYALGSAYERAGQPDAAIAQMRALLAVHPDHAEAMNFVGYTLAERGLRLDEAERLVRRALELKPRAGHVLDSLGWVLFRRGDFRGAVEHLERADALTGPDSTILEHLGDAYRAASRPADAARAYGRALESFAQEEGAEGAGKRRAVLERKLREVGGRKRR